MGAIPLRASVPATAYRVDRLDTALVILFLLGIYLGIEIKLSAGTPVPAVLAGLAGGLMLLKHMRRLQEGQVLCLLIVLAVYLLALMMADDAGYLRKRSTGLLQLAYSFIIGYGFYLTFLLHDRRPLTRIFLTLTLVILVGCALEIYLEPFRRLSDTVRGIIFDFGVYASDRRDIALYGQIRPKFFTSEPSAVAFGFVLFSFCWFVLSEWRWKLAGYGLMFVAGMYLMRGPTLMLGLVLVGPYELFLAPRREVNGKVRYNFERGTLAILLALVLAIAAVAVGQNVYADRIAAIRDGTDPSFFSRVTAPFLVAVDVMRDHPVAGIGLTSENMIDGLVNQIYAQSGGLVSQYSFSSAKYALTNYFWTHWIYLGLIWGLIALFVLSLYLRSLRAPSILFCWSVWAIFGQASGAYVSPKTWIVLYLACAVSILQQRASASPALVPRRRDPLPTFRNLEWRGS